MDDAQAAQGPNVAAALVRESPTQHSTQKQREQIRPQHHNDRNTYLHHDAEAAQGPNVGGLAAHVRAREEGEVRLARGEGVVIGDE